MNKRPWRWSCYWNHVYDSCYCHIYTMEVRIQYLRRLSTTALCERNISGYKGLGTMWFTEMELQQSFFGQGSSSNDGATHTDDGFWTEEFPGRFLGIIIFVPERGMHLPKA